MMDVETMREQLTHIRHHLKVAEHRHDNDDVHETQEFLLRAVVELTELVEDLVPAPLRTSGRERGEG